MSCLTCIRHSVHVGERVRTEEGGANRIRGGSTHDSSNYFLNAYYMYTPGLHSPLQINLCNSLWPLHPEHARSHFICALLETESERVDHLPIIMRWEIRTAWTQTQFSLSPPYQLPPRLWLLDFLSIVFRVSIETNTSTGSKQPEAS